MDKVLRIVSLKEKHSDFAYWTSKSYNDRFDAMEFLREQYNRKHFELLFCLEAGGL